MKQYKKALVALSLDQRQDLKILDIAKEMVQEYQTQLTLMHCLKHMSAYAGACGLMAGIDLESILARQSKEMIMEEVSDSNLTVENALIVSGLVADSIIQKAQELGSDVILIGKQPHSWMMSLLKQNLYDKVSRMANCDVLAIDTE